MLDHALCSMQMQCVSAAQLEAGDANTLHTTADMRACCALCTVQERVAAAGGSVFNNSGLRVMGILQCTRAIGDKDLQPYGVTPTPDVLSLPRTGQEEFLVLATDGLWDVVSNEVRTVSVHANVVLTYLLQP
jgi:hypothetical protein